ncbi:MAG TPA: AzlC family ABC transporter permease [Usitatibacter sp.]|nr:AzlC family ABC transporter permease [Usitatibacter sp.]
MPSPREEFLAGSREIAPALVGTMPFGLVTGVASIAAGMSPVEGIALSVLAFSGIAQLVTSQLIALHSPLPLVLVATLVVSLRLVMYSATLSPHLAHLNQRWRLLLSYLMTDQSFASTVRRYAEADERAHKHYHFLGSSLTLWVSWQLSVIAGVVAGAGVPEGWSLDFVVVLTFLALLVPVIRNGADVAAAIVAAVVAMLAAGLPYRLSLIAGSLAGIVAGIALDASRRSSR